MIPINRPQIGHKEIEAVIAVLKSGRLTEASPEGGPFVQSFERALARFLGVKHVVALASGSAALYASLMAVGIGKGDEVLIPSFTFVSTANAVLNTGAKPVFVDVKRDYTLDAEDLQRKLTEKSKAVIPVHLYGYPCSMDEIMKVCDQRGLWVVEDAAQSLGAMFKGRQTGSIGHLGCFSFYGSKIITCGEGGAITTNDDELAAKLRRIRTHGGLDNAYDVSSQGYNMRMPEMQAALGLAQMKRLGSFLKARRKNASALNARLANIKQITLPPEDEDRLSNWYVFTIAVSSNRDEVLAALNGRGVGATVYYKTPVHRTQLYSGLGYTDLKLPNTDWAANHVLSLPVHPSLRSTDLGKIAFEVEKAVSRLVR